MKLQPSVDIKATGAIVDSRESLGVNFDVSVRLANVLSSS